MSQSEALQSIYDYANAEALIAEQQAEKCMQFQDYRAMDRHLS